MHIEQKWLTILSASSSCQYN